MAVAASVSILTICTWYAKAMEANPTKLRGTAEDLIQSDKYYFAGGRKNNRGRLASGY